MKRINVLLIIILFTCSQFHCDDNDTEENACSNPDSCYCDTEDPINDLIWLKEIIDIEPYNETDTIEIYYCIYDNIEGFLIDICKYCPDAIGYFFDCEGNEICKFGGYIGYNTCPDFGEKLTKIELIYQRPEQ